MQAFDKFYKYYLQQHQTTGNRVFHFLGIFFTFWVLIYISISGQERFFWYLPLTLVLLPMLGHLIYERKSTLTEFKNPLFSLISDFLLFFQLIAGKQKFRQNVDRIIR